MKMSECLTGKTDMYAILGNLGTYVCDGFVDNKRSRWA